jgi:fructose-bisphosphate aldolase class I
VIEIVYCIPTDYAIVANAHALAQYAALCQEAGIVPIVEPEVLMDGDNTIEVCFDVTSRTLHAVFDDLYRHNVDLAGTVLKPNMVIAGKKCPVQSDAASVAHWTARCLLDQVPAAVPGIAFLSGGQSDLQATENLNAINALGPLPWKVTFSYGRALQAPALAAWGGKPENVEAAQRQLALRGRCNGAAALGTYTAAMEELASAT